MLISNHAELKVTTFLRKIVAWKWRGRWTLFWVLLSAQPDWLDLIRSAHNREKRIIAASLLLSISNSSTRWSDVSLTPAPGAHAALHSTFTGSCIIPVKHQRNMLTFTCCISQTNLPEQTVTHTHTPNQTLSCGNNDETRWQCQAAEKGSQLHWSAICGTNSFATHPGCLTDSQIPGVSWRPVGRQLPAPLSLFWQMCNSHHCERVEAGAEDLMHGAMTGKRGSMRVGSGGSIKSAIKWFYCNILSLFHLTTSRLLVCVIDSDRLTLIWLFQAWHKFCFRAFISWNCHCVKENGFILD